MQNTHQNQNKRISNCLRKYRKVMGYTQQQVAEFLQITNPGMISLWEQGHHMPSSDNLMGLAALYCTTVEGLYPDVSREKREFMRLCKEKKGNPTTTL